MPPVDVQWSDVNRIEARIYNNLSYNVWAQIAYFDYLEEEWIYPGDWILLPANNWHTIAITEQSDGEFDALSDILVNFGAYQGEGDIYVDWIRGIQQSSAWQYKVDGIPDTQYIITGLEESYAYVWSVAASDNNGATVSCKSDFTFVVADRTPPEFAITLMPSTVLPNQLDIYAFASEPLSAQVTGNIKSSVIDDTQNMTKLTNRYAETYFLDYVLTKSGTYTISVCGEDDFGNKGCSQKPISVAILHAGESTDFEESDRSLGVSIPGDACQKDGLLISSIESILPEEYSDLNIPNELSPHSILVLISSVGPLRSPAKLWFDTDVLGLLTDENNTLAVFRMNGDDLEPLPMVREPHSSIFIAEISRFDKYLIASRYDDETESDEPEVHSLGFTLDQNQPNPFNAETLISYYLGKSSNVKLSIFNILGQEVAVLVENNLPSGSHTTVWNGKDKRGSDCASGLYLYRLRAGSFTDTKRMLLLK